MDLSEFGTMFCCFFKLFQQAVLIDRLGRFFCAGAVSCVIPSPVL